jgi:pimeloyl-ACP methyl ester carboxylesterase
MIATLPGGVELAYDESGSGVPVLFLHGWPHDRTLWAGQLSGLPTQGRCIAPDLRGFGESAPREPFSIAQYADDVAALLDALGIERAVVCGLSMGGYVTFELLRRHRARIRALILTSTRAGADDDAARERRARLIELIAEHGLEMLAERQLRGMLSRSTFDTRPDVRESLRRIMASASPAGAVGGLRAMMARRDSTDLLPGIDVPTIVIGGADDTLTPPEELSAMSTAIPSCRLELIAGAGHVGAFEKPAAFNHLVGEFLSELLHD